MINLVRLKFALLLAMMSTLMEGSLAMAKEHRDEANPVVGVRGLEKGGAAIDTHGRDFEAVNRLETVKVTKEDVAQFLKEGNLH